MLLKYLKDYKPYKDGDLVETPNESYAKFVIKEKIATKASKEETEAYEKAKEKKKK
jgi:hypothetical protein